MEKIKLYDIIDAVNGSYGLPADIDIQDISTDTRTISKGSLFVALQGANFDGHDFAKQAIEQGACAVVSQKRIDGVRCVMVDSTAKALLDIASFYRDKLSLFTVGVTGSVGKTTTKDFISLVLSKKYKTFKTKGNLNNEIGVPKTVFSMDNSYEAGVVEMGMSHAGEISRLSYAAKPDMAVITNIGYSHIENLGSRENILKAKLEILDFAKYSAPLVINLDDDMLSRAREHITGRRVITYSVKNKNADVYAENIVPAENGVEFDIVFGGEAIKAKINVPGIHNVLNALCAFCVGDYFNVSHTDIVEAISEYSPEGLRQNISEKNGVKVIADCYNAAPDSMKSALSVLSQVNAAGRKIAVLADMLELGGFSVKLHQKVGEMCIAAKPDILVCYGKLAKEIADKAKTKIDEVHYFSEKEDAVRYLNGIVQSGDALLFKGSRGMKLEGIMDALEILNQENERV